MDIVEFFNLPADQRDYLFNLHRKQKQIRASRETIISERKQLDIRESNNQLQCEHFFATKKYKAFQNEFGNFTGGGEYHRYCDDCGLHWTEPK